MSSIDVMSDTTGKAIAAKIDSMNTYLAAIAGNTGRTEPKSWSEVQNIVRNGLAPKMFSIGDQFIVEKEKSITASAMSSSGQSGITDVEIDGNAFIAAIGVVQGGEYEFAFDGVVWRYCGSPVLLSDYGITTQGKAMAGDVILVLETTEKLIWDIIGFDHDTPVDNTKTHSMTLQLHNLWSSVMAFDAPEAIWYVDKSTYPLGLVAGTYYFTLPAGYDDAYGGGSTLNFTITQTVPVGGQVCFGWKYNTQAVNCEITTYTSVGATTVLESVTVTGGVKGVAMPSLHQTDITQNTNCVQRMRYGSNNWLESSIRQWLNTDKTGGAWWEAKTVFDRPANANSDGFLKGLDPTFLSVVGNITKTTQKSVSDGYGLNTSVERFFLLSRPEVYTGAERSSDDTGSTAYEYYGAGYSDLTSASIEADTNRIKYKDGSAIYWWLRTPNAAGGGSCRRLNPTGYLSSDSALNNWGVAPACVIV